MIHELRCAPITPRAGALVVDWDDEAGTVSGPGAEHIQRWARCGTVPLHPRPATHTLSDAPLKTPADLAAIIGIDHHLPEFLAGHYPAPISAEDDVPGDDEWAEIFPDAPPRGAGQTPASPVAPALIVY